MKTEEIKNIEQEAAEMILAFETWMELAGGKKNKELYEIQHFFHEAL